MTKQQKTEILQDIFKGNGKTIGRINQKDVASDIGMDLGNMNKYITGKVEPGENIFRSIVWSAQKIAKSKYDFILQVEDY